MPHSCISTPHAAELHPCPLLHQAPASPQVPPPFGNRPQVATRRPITHSCPVPAPFYAMLTTPLSAAQAGSVPHYCLSRCPLYLSGMHAQNIQTAFPPLNVQRWLEPQPHQSKTTHTRHSTSHGNLHMDIIHNLRLGNATCWRMQTSSVDFTRHTAGALHRSIGPIAINAIPNAPSAWATPPRMLVS